MGAINMEDRFSECPEGALDFATVTICRKAYPDTNFDFSLGLFSAAGSARTFVP